MMDTELIKMCDCPEIQDRWKPKQGDKIILPSKGEYGDDVIITASLGDSIVIVNCGVPYEISQVIHIPRIEDVLEWLLEKGYFDSWYEAGESVACGYYSYDMAIKGWLAMAMHLEHSKTWNGEAWV